MCGAAVVVVGEGCQWLRAEDAGACDAEGEVCIGGVHTAQRRATERKTGNWTRRSLSRCIGVTIDG